MSLKAGVLSTWFYEDQTSETGTPHLLVLGCGLLAHSQNCMLLRFELRIFSTHEIWSCKIKPVMLVSMMRSAGPGTSRANFTAILSVLMLSRLTERMEIKFTRIRRWSFAGISNFGNERNRADREPTKQMATDGAADIVATEFIRWTNGDDHKGCIILPTKWYAYSIIFFQ
jgi:hypothetical protein